MLFRVSSHGLWLGTPPTAADKFVDVKNPISLAKVILEQSSKPLSLRRVPPNLLVGEGARGFAKAYGVPTVPNHELVSKNARDRYLRWQEDLRRAESQEESASGPDDQSIMAEHVDDMRLSSSTSLTGRHREHYQAIMTGTWNEGQPDSPASSSDPGSPASVDSPTRSVSRGGAADISYRPSASRSSSTLNIRCRNHLSPDRTQPAPHQGQSSGHGDPRLLMGSLQRGRIPVPIANVSQGSADRDAQRSPNYGAPMDADGAVSHDESKNEKPATPKVHTDSSPDVGASDPPEDMITDTVGAIAIDFSGNMAAGSSSGGIGMKHRGRIGPAALVGVGTAIIPAADEPPLPPRSSQCARQPGQIPLENGSRSHRRDCQQIATTAVDGGCVHGHHVMGSGKAKQTHHRARHGARGDCTCRDGAEAAENGSDNASSGSTSGSSSSGKDLQSSSASWPNTWSGDDQAVSVAAVTSGTGEHMATTMAAQRIAERLYHSTRRGPGGRTTPEPDEDRALEAFILDDFMDHPGVKNAHSQGAIGVMAVKKARKGFYFYFAHNTESFALASFASDEREPKVVMSRIGDLGEVARGGRKIRID